MVSTPTPPLTPVPAAAPNMLRFAPRDVPKADVAVAPRTPERVPVTPRVGANADVDPAPCTPELVPVAPCDLGAPKRPRKRSRIAMLDVISLLGVAADAPAPASAPLVGAFDEAAAEEAAAHGGDPSSDGEVAV